MARPQGGSQDPSAVLDELLDDLLVDAQGGGATAEPRALRTAEGQEDGEKDGEKAGAPASPLSRSVDMARLDEEMSREIAQLSKEMSACLASLSSWEEERQQRNDAYRAALEACRGSLREQPPAEGSRGPSPELRRCSVDSPMGEDSQPERGCWRQPPAEDAWPASRSAPMVEAAERARFRALALAEGADAVQADEERTRQLREEVELLRRAEEALDSAGDATPPPWDVPQNFQSSLEAESMLVAAVMAAAPDRGCSNAGLLEELDVLLGECDGEAPVKDCIDG